MNEQEDFRVDITENRAFTTEEVAERIESGTSTVRKYCLALEKFGYSFKKDNNLKRIFELRDIQALERLVFLRKKSGISVDNAASIVANAVDENGQLKPMEQANFEVSKGALERKMFVDFQEEMENALILMREKLEEKMLEENRALKNEVILLRNVIENKLLEGSPNEESKLPELLEKLSNSGESKQEQLLQENEQLKQQMVAMNQQAEKTNELLAQILKEKEEEKPNLEPMKEEKKGFLKRFFS